MFLLIVSQVVGQVMMAVYCSKNLSTIRKREFHLALTSRIMLCCGRSETHIFILNYNLLKMFETSLKHEISKATLLTEKLMLLPQDGLSHGGPLQPHHNSSRSGSPLCNGTDAVNLLGCQVMGWAKHSTFKSFTVSSATSILLALSTVAAATFVFIWNFSIMQFISSSTMRPVCDSYTAVLSAECSVVHRNC